MTPVDIEQSLRLFLKFAEHRYAESLALKELIEQAGIDWKREILLGLVATMEKAGEHFAPLYTAAAT